MSLSFKATYFSDFVIMHFQYGQMTIAKHSATLQIVLRKNITFIDTVADRKKLGQVLFRNLAKIELSKPDLL
jgi:uncharacterized protein YjfI (DUF2170 family)